MTQSEVKGNVEEELGEERGYEEGAEKGGGADVLSLGGAELPERVIKDVDGAVDVGLKF